MRLKKLIKELKKIKKEYGDLPITLGRGQETINYIEINYIPGDRHKVIEIRSH